MHILQVNTEKGWRGGERQTLLSMEGLRDAGVTVTLLCLSDSPLYERAVKAGFPVVGVSGQFGALQHMIFRGNRYSVIHAQSSRAFGFASLATLFIRTPVVYTRRVDFIPRGILTKWKYHRAAALVAISNAIGTILSDAGMGEARVISSIVPDYTPDTTRAERLREELHCSQRTVVGVVAALVGHKDPLTMVQAAKEVAASTPDVLFLHFGDGALRSDVETAIQRLSLTGYYRLMGHQSGVEDYFQLFDCFAMSSKEEGLGSSVLDAFKYGIPVASTTAGGLAELVAGRGLLSPPGDAPALADNIRRLLTDASAARQMAEKAKTYVAAHHSRKVLTTRYISLYREITASEPAKG